MAWNFDIELIIHILEEAGFDAIENGNIDAVKEEGDINHQLYINPKGRVRYQYSRLLSEDSGQIDFSQKKLSFDKENRSIVNIIGQLDSIDELVEFIRKVNSIIGEGR